MPSVIHSTVHLQPGPKRGGTRRGLAGENPVRGTTEASSPLDLVDVRVLVVESDAATAGLLRAVLCAEGCDTRVSPTAEDALIVLVAFVPRVIVLDLVLPSMSGLLFVQGLKAADATRDIVLIGVSVIDASEAGKLALGAGCAGYLRRPVDGPSLMRLIRSSLGGSH